MDERLNLSGAHPFHRPPSRVAPEAISHWPLSEDEIERRVRDTHRVQRTRRLGLLKAGLDAPMDQVVGLARSLLSTPVAFVGVVGEDFDFYKSLQGVGEPLASERVLRGRTFCHYTHSAGKTLALSDALALPAPWPQVPTVTSMGIRAYLGVPIQNEGDVVASLCVVSFEPREWSARDLDILEALALSFERELETRVQLAALQQLVDEREGLAQHVERLVSAVAHELRDPQAVASLCATTLERRPTEANALASAPRLKQASEDIGGLVSRLQTDWLAVVATEEVAPHRLDHLVQQVHRMFLPLAARENVLLVLGGVAEVQIRANAAQFIRLLANVVDNAIRYSPGGGQVTLSARAGDAGVAVIVADQGPGMAPDELAQCFVRGYQGAAGLARGCGAGLGLGIARDIAQWHGADLQLRSELGHGVQAVLTWPVSG